MPAKFFEGTIGARHWLLLLALFAVVYVTRLGDGPLVFEEGRRATPAREMLKTGDYVVPRLYGETYLHKPPVFFWLVAGIGALMGQVEEWAVRLPSVLSALLALVLLYGWGRSRLDAPTRWLAVLFALGCPMLVEKGRLGEIDVFLSLLVLAGLSLWWHGYEAEGPRWLHWVGIGALLGISILTKGPSGPLLFYLPLVTFLLWQRQLGQLFSWGHLLGLGVAALPTLAWVEMLRQSGVPWEYLLGTWLREAGVSSAVEANFFLERLSEFPRLANHFLIGCLPLWPWLLLGWWTGFHRRLREGSLARFLFCACVPAMLFVCVFPIGRARHALFVCYPLCLLAAMHVRVLAERWPEWKAGGAFKILAFLPGLAGLGVLAGCLKWAPNAWPQVVPAVLVLLGVTVWLVRENFHGDLGRLACNLGCWTAALGFGVVALRNELADRRALPKVLDQLVNCANSGLPSFATSTYSGGRAVDFNAQFYLGPQLQPLHSLSQLPDVAACIATVYTSERDAIAREGRYAIKREIGLGRSSFGEDVVVLELMRTVPGGEKVSGEIDP